MSGGFKFTEPGVSANSEKIKQLVAHAQQCMERFSARFREKEDKEQQKFLLRLFLFPFASSLSRASPPDCMC